MLKGLIDLFVPNSAMPSRKSQSKNASQGETISETQSRSSFAREVQTECNLLAEQIARLPATVWERLSQTEEILSDGQIHSYAESDYTAQLQKANFEIQRKESTIRQLRVELDAHKLEIQQLRAKEQSLRDLVHESDTYPEVSEHEVISAFVGLRQKVQKLVSSRMYRMEGKPLCTESKTFIMSKDLSNTWNNATQANRKLMLRSFVYQRLADEILAYEFFGILESNSEDDVASSKTDNIFTGLSHFERFLVKNEGRSLCPCIEAMGLARGPFGKALARQMYDDFAPFIVDEATREDKEKLLEGFMELCDKAYSLRLFMRKSKSNYQCHNISLGSPVEGMDRWADVFGELEGTQSGRNTVVLTLFGVLVSQAGNSRNDLRILEKAQIIVRRR
ncbi:phage C domain protein [Fusarium subglutinans]|uniref:Phage C domain protein n=1 Tax=Gibberella subglutinans TaxID=42677 RepID=A0A8H5L2X2_GIBSU|nr:phage C domain protein [Fusarium subglutinans]KAF5584412.1 phage C domain protein [Fusarium subglutinans]